MKSLPGREVFSWDVGRVEETREEEGIMRRSVPAFFPGLWFQRSPGCKCGFHRLKLGNMCVQKLPKNETTWWDSSVSDLGNLGCNFICVVLLHQLCDVG